MYLLLYPANDKFGFGEVSRINKVTKFELGKVSRYELRVVRESDGFELQPDGTWKELKTLKYSKWDLDRLGELIEGESNG